MNNAVVIGWGTVGKATAAAFGIKNYYSRSESNMTLKQVSECKYIFICLPTPTTNSKCDTSAIETFIKKLLTHGPNQSIIIIRSTVYPGFNRFLQSTFGLKRVVSNPEFLSEDTATQDAKYPFLTVIGSDDTATAEQVRGIYTARFKNNHVVVTDSITAELIKYSLNTFFAMKVVFANEIFDYAKKVNANYETIKNVLTLHPWGSHNHFNIWHKGGRGAGGKCLEKDLEAFVRESGSVFFQAANVVNKRLLKESPKNE